MVPSLQASPAAADEDLKLSVSEQNLLRNADPQRADSERTPWWTGLVLCSAILAVSSAAAAFKYIEGAAPITRAGWRLQVTTLAVSPLAYAQWRTLAPELRRRAGQPATLGLLALSGACLAVHFGTWVYSIDHTSLPHSLLLVCSSPLVLAVAYCLTCRPISWGEIGGVALGTGGAALLALSAKSDRDVTVQGDVAAVLAAAAFCGYITCGKSLRDWLPLFCYSFPVSLVAALLLASAGMVLEGSGGLVDNRLTGPFSFVTHSAYLLPVLYLALGPGIVGHAGLNAVLRYMSPLSLSLAVCVEPLLGSLLGWGLQVSALPRIFTWAGGVLLIVATIVTQMASQQRLELAKRRPGGTELVLLPLSAPDDVLEGTEEKLLFEGEGLAAQRDRREREALLEEGAALK
ncbi:hypothetical protein KFL_004890070 [Klebsormidium nitens]|uniref:Uncharacterized protein n=1 Tax=Klebsormidium nitens TaxID=105231 RepID=A0A1Y1IDU0_KLENI|nr:hypothetical protein KFL_004890070 [Klebsormidium nitens]|eukprot:GAQ89124.1 hypothetical protein KFL_004890070 [Klebsormidium nitens]